jgi:hypothetical protein
MSDVTAELKVDDGHSALDQLIDRYERLRLSDSNEAETRLKLIDEILRSVLGWTLDDISVEERCSEDGDTSFADYILRTATASIIVEAKRVGATFVLPSKRYSLKLGGVLSQGEVGIAIRQVRDYARKASIQFAVATNGSAWIIFPAQRTDEVPFDETQARVFRDLEDIREHFVEFWELLSRQRVIEGSLQNQLLSTAREPNSRRLTTTVPDTGYRLGRNSVFSLIEPAVAAAFMDETLLADSQALDACYVRTAERVKYDSRLQTYVADAKPSLDHTTVRVRTKKSVEVFDKQIEESANVAPRFIVVLGPVGAGKTTFLQYTRSVSAVEAIQGKVLWLQIDFKKATAADSPRDFIYKELLRFIESDSDFALGDYEQSISRAYRERVDNLRRGPLYLIAKTKKEEFDSRVTAMIMDDYQNVDPYVEQILSYATRTRPGFLVIDNVDQIERDDRQTEIFVEAQAAARRMQLNCVMCIREATYQRSKSSPAFDAFQFDSLYIDAPQVTAVLSRRFAYAKRVLTDRGAEIVSDGGVRFKVPDLSVFFDIVSASVLSEDTGYMIDMLAGGDVRRGLQLVRAFLASAHTSADRALTTYLSDGEYKFPTHEVFRGAVLGQRKYYREEESLVPNVFDAKLDSADLQLLRLHLTNWFVCKSRSEVMEAVHAEILLADLYRVGVSEGDVVATLTQLCDFKVLRTSDGLPFSVGSKVLPTRFAPYLVRDLAGSFAYFEMCLIDTAVFDDGTWHELVVQTRQIETLSRYEKIAVRVERARRFLDYLLKTEERWVVECKRRALEDVWSQQVLHDDIRPALERDLERVVKSADWQYYKKHGISLPGTGG